MFRGPGFWEYQWTWDDNSVGEDHHEIITTYEYQPVTESEIAGNSATTHGSIHNPNGQQFISEIRAVSGDDRSAPLIGGKCSDFGAGLPAGDVIGINPDWPFDYLEAPVNLRCQTVVTQEHEFASGESLYRGPEFWEHRWTWASNSVANDHHEVITTYEFQAATETVITGITATTYGSIHSPNGQQFISEIRAVSGDDRSAPLIGGKCSDFGTGVPDDVVIGPNPDWPTTQLAAPTNLQCTTVVTGEHEYGFGEFLYRGAEFWEHQWTWDDQSVGVDHHEIVTTYEFQPVSETEIVGNSATTYGSIRSQNGQQFISEIRAVSGDDRSAPLVGGKCSDFGTGVPNDVLIGPNPDWQG